MVTGALLVSLSSKQPYHKCIPILITNLPADLQVDEEQKPMSYTQAFQLLPNGAGSYFVYNDIFRLVYAAS